MIFKIYVLYLLTIILLVWFGFRNTYQQHKYGHYSLRPACYWWRKTPDMCQTYVWVEPPAHHRSTRKPHHNKVLAPTGLQLSIVTLGIQKK